MTHLIKFADGLMVEIAQNPDKAVAVAGKSAEKVAAAFASAAETVGTALRAVIAPVAKAARDAGATETEIEFSVGFSVEGNVFLSKVTGDGNILVKVKVGGNGV